MRNQVPVGGDDAVVSHDHVAGDLLVLQSMQRGSEEVDPLQEDYTFWQAGMFDSPGFPKMHFVEHKYAGDPTNWWIPNRACAEAMLRSAGFAIVGHPAPEVYVCRTMPLASENDDPALHVELSPVRQMARRSR